MSTVNYTLRLDEIDKQKAEQVFRALGMSFSTGINIYIKAVGRQMGIPFPLTVSDVPIPMTLMNALEDLQEESKRNGTSDMTMEEIVAEIAEYRKEKRGS